MASRFSHAGQHATATGRGVSRPVIEEARTIAQSPLLCGDQFVDDLFAEDLRGLTSFPIHIGWHLRVRMLKELAFGSGLPP
ncbi:hypothetical protein [Propioniferax innocua]|uniref:hypothetical protein n=1 Tax=Propioniferax innocua TaxID=1753 RepID=UPI0011545CA0|nr:hypothetical protein [Propioniferax innocua]